MFLNYFIYSTFSLLQALLYFQETEYQSGNEISKFRTRLGGNPYHQILLDTGMYLVNFLQLN